MQSLTAQISVKTLALVNSLLQSRLTNLQRFQALLTVGLFGGILLLPHGVLAQVPAGPLTSGAGQAPGSAGQCGTIFWFMSNLYSFIASAFAGLGGASDSVCQVINIVVGVSIFAMVGMILWGLGDHQMNQTPLKKAFQPFAGWMIGLVCVYLVITVAFFGSTIAGAGGRAPGI